MARYTARFLRINLSTREIGTELVPDKGIIDFIGRHGFGINYLYQELAPGREVAYA